MARQLRLDFAGATHHLTAWGNEPQPIFRSDRDRLLFLHLVGETVERFGWSLTAWVATTNHFHLVIETPEANPSRGMQWLMGAYAMAFNRRHRRCGHLFQGRFHSFLIDSETYLAEVLRYVVLNPVRAGLVDDPAKYRWSSYRATAGMASSPAWLDRAVVLERFADDEATAARGYGQFVHAASDSHERLWDKVVNGIFLGTREWAKKMRKKIESRIRSTDHPKKQRAIGRPRMHMVIDAVAPQAYRRARFAPSGGGPLRRRVAWIGWHQGLVTLRTIAASLRLRSEGHVSNLIRWCEREFASDELLLRNYDSAIAALRR